MTDAGSGSIPDASGALRTLFRRAGHELRNAQNAAAVNIEVVRSRVAAGKAEVDSLRSFAENAAKGMEESAELGEALVALCGAIAFSASQGGLTARTTPDGSSHIEAAMSPEPARQLVQRLSTLSKRGGFTAETASAGVIFRIPPEHETNRT